MPSNFQKKCIAIAGAAVLAVFVGCAVSPSAVARASATGLTKLGFSNTQSPSPAGSTALPRDGARIILTQTTVPPSTTDATSSATQESGTGSGDSSSEAVSSASIVEESAVKDAAYCLKCHGPFEKLAARTDNYTTEFGEKVNPHKYVPHDATSIVECSECHEPHPIPYNAATAPATPTVDYCYSCHHTQTFVTCSECHKE